ncbi:hypothetical protein L1785_15030 [Antribacter sp. KLBMP9083]|uniref:Uncharacterized protein n=1 Tax=Antribacter soli TaxID=2910976 RepID=A0AA41QFR5_9MICO|nr:hypothetical protein [Antribacter soli]MCF4122291.1 hypothetical protein [Antribacter soli]
MTESRYPRETTGKVADVASQAGDAAKGLAQETTQKAGEVAHEATRRARNLTGLARDELRGQAQVQQQRVAEGLRSLGDELTQMAASSPQHGYASDLAERAGSMSRRAAFWFEDRDPGSVLTEVQDFARRRPGLFLAIAAGAGVAVGRLARGLQGAGTGMTGITRLAEPYGAEKVGAGAYKTGSYTTGPYETSTYPTGTRGARRYEEGPYGAGAYAAGAYGAGTTGAGTRPADEGIAAGEYTGAGAASGVGASGLTSGAYPTTADELPAQDPDVPTRPASPTEGGNPDVERT